MALTKRQKALCILCAACLTILVIDRASTNSESLGPKSAEASMYSSEAAGSAAALSSADALREFDFITEEVTTVADRLEKFATTDNTGGDSWSTSTVTVRDAFAPTAQWCNPCNKAKEKPVTDNGHNDALKFAKSHRLTAVAVSSDGKLAVVDNTCMRLGEKLDGYQLVAVEKDLAVFQKGQQKVSLELKQSGGSVFGQSD